MMEVKDMSDDRVYVGKEDRLDMLFVISNNCRKCGVRRVDNDASFTMEICNNCKNKTLYLKFGFDLDDEIDILEG